MAQKRPLPSMLVRLVFRAAELVLTLQRKGKNMELPNIWGRKLQ